MPKINFFKLNSFLYFAFQSAFMNEKDQSLHTLQDIKRMMEKSSRFISLSGWSGVAAGLCALVGAWQAYGIIGPRLAARAVDDYDKAKGYFPPAEQMRVKDYMGQPLLQIAVVTFLAALVLAFFFTWLRSRHTGMPLLGTMARRLTLAVGIPMVVGGLYLLQLMKAGAFGLIAPGCLLFYGLGLINAARYTSVEIKYLGYSMLLLGVVNTFLPGYGLFFWALGFGVLHIVYGLGMWYRYERPGAPDN